MKNINREEGISRLSSVELSASHPSYIVYFYLLSSLRYAAKNYAIGKLLDIGCGNKPYKAYFKDYVKEHIGCDIVQSSENAVDVICEATSIPLPDNNFNTILCTQVIEHVADHNELLKEAYRLLNQGGYIILTGPMYWPLHEEPYDFFRFTKHGFKHLLEKVGFEVIEVQENGGKWSVLGQVICLTLPKFPGRRHILKLCNELFIYLDRKYYDSTSTSNYLIIGMKK